MALCGFLCGGVPVGDLLVLILDGVLWAPLVIVELCRGV